MPEGWIAPAVFMSYRGVKIYHTYRDDRVDQPVSDSVYGTSELVSYEGSFDKDDNPIFYVCDLPGYSHDLTDHLAIRRAIDQGHFKGWEGVPDPLTDEPLVIGTHLEAYREALHYILSNRWYHIDDIDFDSVRVVENKSDGATVSVDIFVDKEVALPYIPSTIGVTDKEEMPDG